MPANPSVSAGRFAWFGVPPPIRQPASISRPSGTERAKNGPMKTTNSTIHYQAAPQQQVSKKTVLILFASAIGVAGILFAIIH
jgi:hypothetical protein